MIDRKYNCCKIYNDVLFHNFSLPGSGYPFDNLQMSAVWVGTPLYVLGTTLDGKWSLVFTPLAYLIANGKKLTTIVYIGGHVFLYIGNTKKFTNKANELVAMTYQNVWGLKPTDNSRRTVIGKAVFIPLLKTFPEDKRLNSYANLSHFQIAYLDELPEKKLDMAAIILRSLEIK